MTHKFKSEQESVLEELMQKSFGAQNLYLPKEYKKQNGRINEPCDLAWFGNGVLVLFYLTSGTKSIKKQDEHNLKQAKNWINYWRKKPELELEAINRFKDKLSIKFSVVEYCVCISIISHNTGIVFHKSSNNKPLGFTCTVPEYLIHAVAREHGTVIDLLEIIQKYSLLTRPNLIKHNTFSKDRLISIVNNKETELKNSFDYIAASKNDFEIIYSYLGIFRQDGTHRQPSTNIQGRQMIADHFSDMSAKDFITLALAATSAIENTDKGNLTFCVATESLFQNWLIIATNFNASNCQDYFKPALELAKEKKLATLLYSYTFEGVEHRSPLACTLPGNRSRFQSQQLVNKVVLRLKTLLIK